jgi:hypothetical protein
MQSSVDLIQSVMDHVFLEFSVSLWYYLGNFKNKKMNKTKKLVLVSLSTAVSFVLIMGLETVFSSMPSTNPPATNLTPTFNGLTVGSPTDGITLNKDGLSRAGGTPFILNSPTARKIQISNGVVFEVLNNLIVAGTTYLKNVEIGSGLTPSYLTVFGDTEVKENLEVTKDINVSGDIDVNGILKAKIGGIEASQIIASGDITTGASLSVSGDIEMKGTGIAYLNSTELGATTIGKEIFPGNKPLQVYGTTTIGSPSSNNNLNVYGNSYLYGDLDNTSGNTKVSNINISGNVLSHLTIGTTSANKNLTVNGKIKAKSLGLISRRAVSKGLFVNGANIERTEGCLTGEIMLSCSPHGALANRYAFTVRGVNIFNNTCYVWATNTSGANAELFVSTTCLDTNG